MSASGANSYIAVVKADPSDPTTPPTSPTMQKINFAAASLTAGLKTKVSNHITGNRGTANVAVVGSDVGGSLDFEMHYEASLNDEMLAAALMAMQWQIDTDEQFITDGKYYQPFYIEEGFTDVNKYFQYAGMAINVFNLEIADQDFIGARYDFVGLDVDTSDAPVGSTYNPASENPIMTSASSVSDVKIDDVAISACQLKDLTLTIDNGFTPKTGVSVLGACSTNAHRLNLEGSMTMYFEDHVMFNRLLNSTPFDFKFTITDADGNYYEFHLPRVRVKEDDIPITGIDDDVMDNVSIQALHDETSGYTIKITRPYSP